MWLSFCAIFIKNFTIDTTYENINVACSCVFCFLASTSINYEYWLSEAVSCYHLLELIHVRKEAQVLKYSSSWFTDQLSQYRNRALRLTLKFLLSYQHRKFLHDINQIKYKRRFMALWNNRKSLEVNTKANIYCITKFLKSHKENACKVN